MRVTRAFRICVPLAVSAALALLTALPSRADRAAEPEPPTPPASAAPTTIPELAGPAGPLPEFRGSGANTGVGSGPIRERPGVLWTFDAEGALGYPGQPVRLGDSVYVGCGSGNVYALDADSGKERWRFRTGGGVYASPLVHGGVVIVGSYDGAIHGIDMTTGARRWRVPTGDVIESSACLTSGGLAVLGSFDGSLYAVDPASGDLRWKSDVGDSVYGSPACADGHVFIGAGKRLVAVDDESGEEVWSSELDDGDYVSLAPAVAGDRVIMAGQAGRVYAFEADDGVRVWTATIGRRIRDAVAVADDTVYACALEGACSALSLADGSRIWEVRWLHKPAGAPVVADGMLYVPANAGDATILYALDAGSGGIRWDYRLAGTTRTSPMLFDGLLLMGTESGHVHALSSEARRPPHPGGHIGVATVRGDFGRSGTTSRAPVATPRVLWRSRAGDGIRPAASPVMAGGLVLLGSADGFLYAFDAAGGEEVWRYGAGSATTVSATVVDGIVYHVAVSGRLTALELFSGTSRWDAHLRGEPSGAPCFVAGQVVVGTGSGAVHARDAESGDSRWTYKTPGPVAGELACTVGVTYVTTRASDDEPAHLIALNAASGTPMWDIKLDADAGDVAGPVARGNRVIVATTHWVYAFEATSARRMWRASSHGGPVEAPAVDASFVYACTGTGEVSCTAFRLSSGGIAWRSRIGSVTSAPTVGMKSKLLLTPVERGGHSRVAALRSTDGKEAWSLDLGKTGHVSATLVDGTLLVAASDGSLFAVGDVLPRGVRPPMPETRGDERLGYVLFRGSSTRSGSFAGTAPKRPDEVWTARAGRDIGWPGQAILFDGRVFLGSGSPGGIFAFDARSGEELWSYETEGGVYSSPTYWNGLVLIGSYDRSIYALDARTGKLRWRFKTGGIIEASVCVGDGIAYVGSFDGRIYAIEAASGRELWSYNSRGSLATSPTCSGGVVYGGGVGDSSPGQLFALDGESGRELWMLATKEKPTLAIAEVGEHLFASGDGGTIWVIDKKAGRVLREMDGPGPARDALAVSEDAVFACADNGECAAYAVADGKERWRVRVGKSSRGAPVRVGDIVVVLGMNVPPGSDSKADSTDVLALDARTGAERWRVSVSGSTRTSPGFYEGLVLVGTENGELHAIGDDRDGRSGGRSGTRSGGRSGGRDPAPPEGRGGGKSRGGSDR